MSNLEIIDIEKLTLQNNKKGPVIIFEDIPKGRIQIGVSSLKRGETIPWEIHHEVTQFVKVEDGEGYVQIKGKKKMEIKGGDSFTIPSHKLHLIKCTGKTLKLYSIYAKDSSAEKWIH